MSNSANYRDSKGTGASLHQQQGFSKASAEFIDKCPNRRVHVTDPGNLAQEPVYFSFLIDASGSMQRCEQAVIKTHQVMLKALRESAKCRKGVLFVNQYLYNDNPSQLHPFTRLAPAGRKDDVAVLSSNNYQPGGQTALYKTLYLLLQEIAVYLDLCNKQGIFPQFIIGVLTDGEDNIGGVDPANIARFLGEMRQKEYLWGSAVVGLLGGGLDDRTLQNIKQTLGFDQAVSVPQDERHIRRIFLNRWITIGPGT